MTRPERIELTAPGEDGAVVLSVGKRVFQGDRVLVHLFAPGGQSFSCTVPSLSQFHSVAPGTQVGARFRETRALPADAT